MIRNSQTTNVDIIDVAVYIGNIGKNMDQLSDRKHDRKYVSDTDIYVYVYTLCQNTSEYIGNALVDIEILMLSILMKL